ncbi:MAG TPA: hypothetical protein VJY33_14665 [Isosphaeraceae bacterium]|nr:hypothetical protein [Isosphaeraceae bacterium]
MILFVPLSRFQVSFERGSGRPYSSLEALMLRAIEQGAGTLDELRDSFEVHPRLLIEALVTLTQAGWLAVSSVSGKSFVLTPEGRKALLSGDKPSSLQSWPDDTYVLMERLTGSVIYYKDIHYVREEDLREVRENCVWLPPRVADEVDESSVDRFLPRAQGEWIRSIGSIELKGRDFQWLPVTLDLGTGTVSGLPDEWTHLHEILVAEARSRAGSLRAGADTAVWIDGFTRRSPAPDTSEAPPRQWPVRLGPADFLYDNADHEQYLREALQGAHSTVFIASAFVSVGRLEAIGDLLAEALRRGVIIDLLWGYAVEDKVINWLHNKTKEAEQERWTGRLRSNRRPSGSHAKVILWNRSAEQFEACLGSCNWLSFTPAVSGANNVTDVSVKLSRPGLLAQLSRCAAGLYKGLRYDSGGALHRRQQEAAEMERLEVTSSPSGEMNAKVSLIQDREHEWSLREWLRAAQHRLLVTSDQLWSVAASRLAAAEGRTRASGVGWAALYGRTELESEQLRTFAENVMKEGGSLMHVPGLHAKVVVSDDTACVSSYNFLSADPFQTASEARELGIVFTGSEPVGWLADRLSPKPSP